MRRKRVTYILLFVSLFVVFLIGVQCYAMYMSAKPAVAYVDTIMGIYRIENNNFLEQKEKREIPDDFTLCFENTPLPYDKLSNTYYLSQNYLNDKWEGRLSTSKDDVYLCIVEGDSLENKADVIRQNKKVAVYAVADNYYYEVYLVITGMPTIAMQTERMEEQQVIGDDPDKIYFDSETLYYGTISIFNPSVGTGEYEILETRLCYHYRGNLSAGLIKKNYAIKLQDGKENDVNVSLLGMRADAGWKLNAMYTDNNRIREVTACQLWEKFYEANPSANQLGPRAEYVELIIDNEYKGVYYLLEPVDEKKLALDRNDALYKIIGYNLPDAEGVQDSVDRGWKMNCAVRVRYPKQITDYAQVWQPVNDYLNLFYRDADEIDYEYALSVVDVDNYMDYLMYIMAITGADNIIKNVYWVADVETDGSYTMRQVPWDLDFTFGNLYDVEKINCAVFNPDYTVIYMENAFPKLKGYYNDAFEEVFLSRWKEYREDFLSNEYITGLLKENANYLVETGAILREKECWEVEGMPITTDIQELIEYQIARMEWLDDYFEEWFD